MTYRDCGTEFKTKKIKIGVTSTHVTIVSSITSGDMLEDVIGLAKRT